MKILHISNSDISGGAARAAYRIHRCLLEAGDDSRMLVANKATIDKEVIDLYAGCPQYKRIFPIYREKLFYRWKMRGLSLSTQFSGNFSSSKRLFEAVVNVDPDIVHLHWMSNMGLSLEVIEKLHLRGYKIAWTLHDEWATTGGVHYIDELFLEDIEQDNKYKQVCELLQSQKRQMWQKVNPAWVCPSRWLADQLKSSGVNYDGLKVEVIPYPINLDLFKPLEQSFCRSLLGLKEDRFYIAFGAISAVNDKRKGFKYLHDAILRIASSLSQNNVEIVVFGSNKPEDAVDFGIPVNYLGMLRDEYSLSLLYNAVDLFVAPSLQDNLPNTVIESLSCNTPVVAFNIGGMPDMIDHEETGYLAIPEDAGDLAIGIERWVAKGRADFGFTCRQRAEEKFLPSKVHQSYKALYSRQ